MEDISVTQSSIGPRTKSTTRCPMSQADVYRMIRRPAKAAGIHTKIGNRTFRATGIRPWDTAHPKTGGRLRGCAADRRHTSHHRRWGFTTVAATTCVWMRWS